MCSINKTHGKPFSAGGCPMPEGNTNCGETRTLDIINEFKRLYEQRMESIDRTNCGDNLQEKIKLQQDWIGQLTEQNEWLVRAVEELEVESIERVRMLEEKLQKSAACICEVMKKYRENDVSTRLLEEPRKRLFNLENDLKNVLEFIRRIRDEKQWSTGGLIFYEITEKDLLGNKKCGYEILNGTNNEYLDNDAIKERNKLKDQESNLHALERKVTEKECLSKELQCKREECESLQKNMVDMRLALTEEVATKHDVILKLKRECQELEERCIQADKQTAFRDDIIKELRKENKQLKQQENLCLREEGRELVEKIIDMRSTLELAKYKIDASLDCIEAKMILVENGKNKNETFADFIEELNKITGPSFRDNLYSFMEKEIIDLNEIVDIKHNQLQELFELNKILIQKLFNIDNGIKYLEERALSTLNRLMENESNLLQTKNHELEDTLNCCNCEKANLLEKVNEAKSTIQSLEIQFNDFLQERDQLKSKYKLAVKQCPQLTEECNKLKAQNCSLKSEIDELRRKFECCCEDKMMVEKKLNELKMGFNNLKGTKISAEEIHKLNKTVDALQTTLEKSRIIHEEEERAKETEIKTLKHTVKELEDCIRCCKQNIMEKETEINMLLRTVKDSEDCICGCKQNIKNKNSEIKMQNQNIQELEGCICNLQKQLKAKESEIKTLHHTVKELEDCIRCCKQNLREKETEINKLIHTVKDSEDCISGCKQNIKNKNSEIKMQNQNIQELDRCICNLQEQLKIPRKRRPNREMVRNIIDNLLLHGSFKPKVKKTKPKVDEELEITVLAYFRAFPNASLRDAKAKNNDISALNARVKELERYIRDLEEKENPLICSNVDILKSKITELQTSISQLQSKAKLCKMCRQTIKVSFTGCNEVQTDAQEPTDEQLELLLNRDELIKYQSCTLEKMQQELQNVCAREKELLEEKQTYFNEKSLLEDKMLILERKLNTVQNTQEELSNKEEIIRKQKEALTLLQIEADNLRKREAEMRSENEECCICMQQLKIKINELEMAVDNAEKRGNNLQSAVDLYNNSINVLEASEEKYKLEIDHQRTTIANLQDALMTTKHELDDYKQKYDESEEDHQKLLTQFVEMINDNDLETELLKKQICELSKKHEKLQELNFNIEVEYCSSLQDVEVLENQLLKYYTLLKTVEEELKICKCNIQKLQKQKQNFEQVIEYFKTEMAKMSQQLQNLQELLNMTNESSQQETAQLMNSYVKIQELNQKLSIQLAAAEQTIALENQMNQLNQTKMTELERIINEKEIDLAKQTAAIQTIKRSLESSLQQNNELQHTISSLNQTIGEFQEIVKKYEEDNCRSKENTALCKTQIAVCRDKLLELNNVLDQKTTELCTLECAYNQQHKSLKCCQLELTKFKEKQKTKQVCFKRAIQQLKEQLSTAQEENRQVEDELNALRTELAEVKSKDSAKEIAILKYRKLANDLKVTLVDLNQILINKEYQLDNLEEEIEQICNQESHSTNTSLEDVSVNCPCEVEYYLSIIESLKKAAKDLIKKLCNSLTKNHELEEELRQTQTQTEQLSKTQLEKDKKYNELKQKLLDILKRSQIEEHRDAELRKKLEKEISLLKQDLENKVAQVNKLECTSKDVCGSMSVQLSVAKEELAMMNEQWNNLLIQQRAITLENDKLHNQNELLQAKVANLEQTSHSLRSKIEQYVIELQKLQTEKESLLQQNQELFYELRSLNVSYEQVASQQRYKEETITNLEDKLNDVKITRDEICFESKNAIDYFRHWLQEQNRINQCVVSKEKNYCKTIDILRQQIQETKENPCAQLYAKCPSPGRHCQGVCNLGSQGNDNESIYSQSPSGSPCPYECDWFASNYKNDSETEVDEDDEDWVSKVENLTEQVKRTGKMWKHKMEMSDCSVTKDNKQ